MYIALKWLIVLNFFLWLALCFFKIWQAKFKDETGVTDFYCITNSSNEDTEFLWPFKEVITYTLQVITLGMIALISLHRSQNWIYGHSTLKVELIYNGSFFKYVCNKYYTISFYLKSNGPFKEFWQSSKAQAKYNTNNTLYYLSIMYLMREMKKLPKPVSNLKQEHLEPQKFVQLATHNRLPYYVEETQQDLSYKKMCFKLCCENSFLRLSLEKLTKEKKAIERNILNVIAKVFLTNNNGLKAYCSQFIVRTKDDFLKAHNMDLEVQRFLTKSGREAFHSKLTDENSGNYTQLNYNNRNRLQGALYPRSRSLSCERINQFNELYGDNTANTVKKIRKSFACYKMYSVEF